MKVRVEVDSVGAGFDLDGAAWTPELLETLLRMCADEVMRICQTLGLDSDLVVGDEAPGDETGAVDE